MLDIVGGKKNSIFEVFPSLLIIETVLGRNRAGGKQESQYNYKKRVANFPVTVSCVEHNVLLKNGLAYWVILPPYMKLADQKKIHNRLIPLR